MPDSMRALAHHAPSGPFSEVELPVPTPGPRDLVVEVRAVSVNPVDTKVHAAGDPGGEPKVLGYDAAGVVTAVGSDVTLFSVGDEVYHSGSIARPGTNAQYHAVDERIVGPKPRSLSFAEAAALPLTTITSWESLCDRFRAGPVMRANRAGTDPGPAVRPSFTLHYDLGPGPGWQADVPGRGIGHFWMTTTSVERP